jgi:Mce-associated membrane protein
VEDQRLAAGDLTDGSADSRPGDASAEETGAVGIDPETSDSESGDQSSVVDENVDGTVEDEDSDVAEAADETVIGVRDRRPVGKWSAIAAGVAALLFVGSAAFAGAVVQPYLADRAIVVTKEKIARTAVNAITTLWSYTPDNVDKLDARAAQYLSSDFEARYQKFVTDTLAAANKHAQITSSTQVVGAAVEKLDGPTATAIVYTNTTSYTPAHKDLPSLKYFSYRLVMQRAGGRWLVDSMTTITTFDLTPKF